MLCSWEKPGIWCVLFVSSVIPNQERERKREDRRSFSTRKMVRKEEHVEEEGSEMWRVEGFIMRDERRHSEVDTAVTFNEGWQMNGIGWGKWLRPLKEAPALYLLLVCNLYSHSEKMSQKGRNSYQWMGFISHNAPLCSTTTHPVVCGCGRKKKTTQTLQVVFALCSWVRMLHYYTVL